MQRYTAVYWSMPPIRRASIAKLAIQGGKLRRPPYKYGTQNNLALLYYLGLAYFSLILVGGRLRY